MLLQQLILVVLVAVLLLLLLPLVFCCSLNSLMSVPRSKLFVTSPAFHMLAGTVRRWQCGTVAGANECAVVVVWVRCANHTKPNQIKPIQAKPNTSHCKTTACRV
jgi:hypothetical protein